MEFRILGPLEVVADRQPLRLGRRKQRAVLAILLVHANRVVSLDRLVEEVWGEEPPPQARGPDHAATAVGGGYPPGRERGLGRAGLPPD